MATTRPTTFLRGGVTSNFLLETLMPDDTEGVITHLAGGLNLTASGTFILSIRTAGASVPVLQDFCSSIPTLPIFFSGLWIPVNAGESIQFEWFGETATDFCFINITGFVYPLRSTFNDNPAGGGGALSLFSF